MMMMMVMVMVMVMVMIPLVYDDDDDDHDDDDDDDDDDDVVTAGDQSPYSRPVDWSGDSIGAIEGCLQLGVLGWSYIRYGVILYYTIHDRRGYSVAIICIH